MPHYVNVKGNINASAIDARKITEAESAGLKLAFRYFLVFFVLLLVGMVPSTGLLRNDAGGFLPSSPLTYGIVPILFFLFMFVGTGYGIGSKAVKTHRDVPKYMAGGLRASLSYFVVAFPAAFFIYFFSKASWPSFSPSRAPKCSRLWILRVSRSPSLSSCWSPS